eukprot:5862158-Ditylum_brightwellii.AAC.1
MKKIVSKDVLLAYLESNLLLETHTNASDRQLGGVISHKGASTAWEIHSTYHTTLGATLGKLIYGRDMIHYIKHVADWELIRLHKQKITDYSTAKEMLNT